MNRLESALSRIQAELTRHRARWAIVGGLAVSARSEPRTTRDIDVALAVSDDSEAEVLIRSLRAGGYVVRHDGVIKQTATGRLATVRLESPGQESMGIVVDLMFASSGIEPEIVADAQPVEVLPGAVMRVASRGHLIALKVLAGRPQDRADLQALLAVATQADVTRAGDAMELIERRGYSRGKNLREEFERAMRQFRSDRP